MPLLIACRLNESKAKQKLESSVQKKRKEKSKQKGDDIAAFYEQHRES